MSKKPAPRVNRRDLTERNLRKTRRDVAALTVKLAVVMRWNDNRIRALDVRIGKLERVVLHRPNR